MMSNEAVMLDMALMGSDLSPAARSVLNCLVKFSDKARACFPAVATIVEKCGYCERTVRNKIKELAKKGWITKQEQYRNNGSQTSNYYIINLTLENANNDQAVPSVKAYDECLDELSDFSALIPEMAQTEETEEQQAKIADAEQAIEVEQIMENVGECGKLENITRDCRAEKIKDESALIALVRPDQDSGEHLYEHDRLACFKQLSCFNRVSVCESIIQFGKRLYEITIADRAEGKTGGQRFKYRRAASKRTEYQCSAPREKKAIKHLIRRINKLPEIHSLHEPLIHSRGMSAKAFVPGDDS